MPDLTTTKITVIACGFVLASGTAFRLNENALGIACAVVASIACLAAFIKYLGEPVGSGGEQ